MKSAVVAYEKKCPLEGGDHQRHREVTEATRSTLMLLWAPDREQFRDPRQGTRDDPPPTLPGQLTWSPRKSRLKSQQVRWGGGGGKEMLTCPSPALGPGSARVITHEYAQLRGTNHSGGTLDARGLGSLMLLACCLASELCI